MQKNILVIGAWRSATTLIDYFLQHAEALNWPITVGDISEELAQNIIQPQLFNDSSE